ncbi:hypothetical protein [Mycobacterium botniense]|uniref:hypothetical protein n=1 Tax=Mycobacterium botniense TaxID=84962 RepID=UPI0015800EBF|nr:hypothetical protein [Mycobacterium botniense]
MRWVVVGCELVIRAGDEVGCGVVEELTLAAPLVVGWWWWWWWVLLRGSAGCVYSRVG